jgi:hypothetical protein
MAKYSTLPISLTTTLVRHFKFTGVGGSGLLLTYKGKDITEEFRTHQKLTYRLADSMVVGTFKKEIKRLIDPDKALMPQIWNVDK